MSRQKRPWGGFELLRRSNPWWVKQITLKRNQRTSLQYHKDRGELHFVVSGIVKYDLPEKAYGEDSLIVKAGHSIWIPKTHQHRMHNVGVSHATIIEIAFGHPVESDIVRIEDDYGRVKQKKKSNNASFNAKALGMTLCSKGA